MRFLAIVVAITACGDGGNARPDAAVDASVDTPTRYPACREFVGPAVTAPAHVTGSLKDSDVQSPAECAVVDAPYGVESAGPDGVVQIAGLVTGSAYIVKLTSPADLAFYVASDCSTASGPSTDECALFVDASAGTKELGRFVAETDHVFVVVDFWGSSSPANQSFTLDVYAEACTESSQCSGATPVCDAGKCVVCASSFDCSNAQTPRCDASSNLCIPGVDSCSIEDASEPGDDGPAGAVALALDGAGAASASGQICSSPRTEADFFSFQVTSIGDIWDLGLTWTGSRDLDLEVFDAAGAVVGLSYWEQPEGMRLTYLKPGTYYASVSDFSSVTGISVPYTLTAQRTAGTGCSSRADCATEYRNQVFRGDCNAGACVPIASATPVAEGGACDSASDCASNLTCPSFYFYFVANADTRSLCARTCTNDLGCAAVGADYVCTSYLVTNFCLQKCTADDQCPTSLDTDPSTGPWYRLHCDLPSGHCVQ